ncbi:polyketide cyclase [Cohnella kolymensis]|uniref:Polyketide cyclase n=1 Tax=Cohnella kolymensis TaxID=1590652 RepID=A0ABR5A0H7_9BACL|nr:SRPBCC domain-containing protein [Cohnella kolymensis]KIL34128.1 polyketide cyclase [Cohnella kolymensis]
MLVSEQQEKLPDIRQTILINAPIRKVWDAVSNSEAIAAWLMPNDFQPVMGFEFTIHSQYGDSPCKVTEIDPPNRLIFTWGDDWVVTFELNEQGSEQTEFTLVHGGWTAGKVEHGMDYATIRDRMKHGWEAAVLPRLRQFIEG